MKKIIFVFMTMLLTSAIWSQNNLQGTIFGRSNPNTSYVNPDTVEGIARMKYFDYTNSKLYNYQDTAWVQDTARLLLVDVASFKAKQPYLRGYKIYKAIVTQYRTDDPTAVVLESTIGSVTWSRLGAGSYRLNATGAFPANKTFVLTQYDSISGWSCERHSDDDILCSATADGLIESKSLEIDIYY